MSGSVLWLTGLPGSGKSSIAEALKGKIPEAVVLRIDEIRRYMTPEPTYSEAERDMVYRALAYTAMKLSELGHLVVVDATANLRKWRDFARSIVKDFSEVYVKCALELCMEREAKRSHRYDAPTEIYKKAKEGWPVPGINVPYEEPIKPELTIESDKTSIETAVRMLLHYLEQGNSLRE